MLILVTGSTGFIGSHLCRALMDAGHRVRAFHRAASSLDLIQDLEIEHAIGDVTRPVDLAKATQGVDVVFHTASKVDYWRGPDNMYPVTVGGTRNVLQAALDSRVQRVLYTSSVASLGVPDASDSIMDETHVWNYRPEWWRYGYAKHLAEGEVQAAAARGLDAVIVNPAMVLGAGDVNRISGEVVLLSARGILRFGLPGGMNAIHIDDAVRGHLAALERGKTGQRYILGGENISFWDLICQAAEITGVHPPLGTLSPRLLFPFAPLLDWLCRLTPLPFNGDLLRFAGKNMFYDNQKAQSELGFLAEKPVRLALQDAFDWYQMQGMI